MDKAILKNLLSRLSKYAFQSFVFELLRYGDGKDLVTTKPEVGDDTYFKDITDTVLSDIYGYRQGLINAEKEGNPDLRFYGIYITHFLPIECLKHPSQINIKDEEIVQKLESISRENISFWPPIHFFNNIAGYSMQEHWDSLVPRYKELIDSGRWFAPGMEVHVGNIDSFVERNPSVTESILKTFLQAYREGICITLSNDCISVNRISSEKPIFSGVASTSLYPYETIYSYSSLREGDLLKEFAALISKNAKESDLEEFLRAHYKDVFGGIYDRIETQLWLRFPEIDIANKDRRLDIFLRNSVSNDWELFEVKRAVQLTRTYRDIPVITSEVLYAVQQVQNYARILAQDDVKKKFAADGIEYFEPVLKLVIGRRPQISQQQWRSLVVSNEKDVKLITFDDLIREMAIRFKDRHWIA